MYQIKNIVRRSLVVALSLVAGTSFAVTANPVPPKLGVMVLNQGLDRVKPLSVLDAGVAIANDLMIASYDNHWVGAWDLKNHNRNWWYKTDSALSIQPAIFGTSVVLGTKSGQIIRLDAVTGKKLWETSIDAQVGRTFQLHGSDLIAISAGQKLYAIEYVSGKIRWLYDGGFPEGLVVQGLAPPLVHGDKILLGLNSGEIVSVSLEDGQEHWKVNPLYLEGRFHDVVGDMVVRNNRLLFSRYDGLVAAMDLNTHSLTWQQKLPTITTSSYRSGVLYIGTLGGDTMALEADQGKILFKQTVGFPVGFVVPAETFIAAVGANGRLTALDPREGTLQWYDDMGYTIASRPVLTPEALYISTGLKVVYGYKLGNTSTSK